MNRLFKKIKHIFIIIIILIIFLSYFIVYLPFRSELQSSFYNNFKNIVAAVEVNLEQHLESSLEAAETLSSRTMIRREIERYKKGEVSFEELREFSQDKYREGAEALRHILAAHRFVEGRELIRYGEDYRSVINSFSFAENEKINEIKISENENYIVVRSIILADNANKLGTDYIIYDLKDILAEVNQLNSEEIDFSIIAETADQKSGINNGNVVEIKNLLATDYYLKAESSTDFIYAAVNGLSYKIILGLLIAILIIYLIMINVLHQASNKVIENLTKDLEEKTRLSEIDKMLEIYNRAKFNQELKKEIDRSKRYGNNLALIMFDIDFFKDFNDNYGHQIGDEVLKKIVSIVRNMVRENDILARYGGDEFMIICTETDLKDAEILAARLNRSINKYSCQEVNDLSCSFGVAEFKGEGDEADLLIQRADKALYRAKRSGRNRVCR